MLDPENYGARVWYRFITRGSWPYICSPKPTLISLLPVICYRIREYGAGLGTGSVSGSDMLHFVRANLEFVNTVVDPDFKFAVKFSPSFTCLGFGAAACPICPPPALCATRQPSFCTPLLLSRPFTGLKALLLPLVPPPVQSEQTINCWAQAGKIA